MQIDWFTLVAQIVNFLILLWLLQRFLYGPILRVMKEREYKLTAQFHAAEAKIREAEQERDALQAEREDLEARREELMQAARDEAAERRRAMIHDARQEADALMSRWYDAIEREKQTFLREVQTRLGEQLMRLVRRSLSDLAGLELEKAIVGAFVTQVQDNLEEFMAVAEAENPHNGRAAATANPNSVRVRTTFELPGELEDAVRAALAPLVNGEEANGEEANGKDSQKPAHSIHFEQAPELICGIEAELQNHRIAWSIRDYLNTIEQELQNEILQSGLAQARRARESYTENSVDEILPG